MPIITTSLTLKDLPPPPPEKTGWPWTEETHPLPQQMPDGSEWPRISVVTPSYNQGQFIEETIRSVLLQGYPNLEYIIIDGGSTDNSVEIIKKYEQYLAYWVSERDRGQSHGINKGFQRATGQFIGWQNSDDYYHPNIFLHVAKISVVQPNIDVVYGKIYYADDETKTIRPYPVSEVTIESMIPYSSVCNQSVFFRDRVFNENNFIDESIQHCMDQEFILRLLVKGYRFKMEHEIVGYYRLHKNAKSSKQMNIWAEEAMKLYKLIYQNIDLSLDIKKKAKDCIYNLCLDNFGKLRLKLFRKSVRELVTTLGITALTPELIVKYLISFLEAENIVAMKKIRNQINFSER